LPIRRNCSPSDANEGESRQASHAECPPELYRLQIT
jgi:hypothetical protein